MNRNDNRIFAYLLLAIIALCIIALLCSAVLGVALLVRRDTPPAETDPDTETPADTQVSVDPAEVILGETPDAGMAYIDKMIFFGESTTAHLRSRGVLSGGTHTEQVWEDKASGTKTLSSKLLSEPIDYPPTGEKLTPVQAAELAQPEYLVLSFGLNNISAFINNKALYVNNYSRLIKAIQAVSPDTKIILQSVYPVTSYCDSWNVDGKTVSEYTKTLNQWLPEIAAAHENVRFVDTASVLTDENGCLNASYDISGDGIHLTAEAYEKILTYLRTHAWE